MALRNAVALGGAVPDDDLPDAPAAASTVVPDDDLPDTATAPAAKPQGAAPGNVMRSDTQTALSGMGLEPDDPKHMAHGVFAGLGSLPDAALDTALNIAAPTSRSPFQPFNLVDTTIRAFGPAVSRLTGGYAAPDLKPHLTDRAIASGYLEPMPEEGRPRFFYNAGRNLGAAAAFAPIVGPAGMALGTLGSTLAGEGAHAAGATPAVEQLAAAAGGMASLAPGPAAGAGLRTGAGLVRPLSGSGRRAVVGEALRSAAGDHPAVPAPAPIEGMPQTFGQATNNPGILALEKTVAKGAPDDMAVFVTLKSDANRRIIERARELATRQAMEHTGPAVRTELDRAMLRSNGREAQLWDGIDPDNVVQVQPTLVRDVVANFEQALPIADRGSIPAWVAEVVDEMAQTNGMTIREVISFDKRLGRELRGAQGQDRHILGDLQRQLRDALSEENLFAQIRDPAAVERWNEARAFTREQKSIFKDNPVMAAAMPDARGGAPRVNPSQLLGHFVRRNGGSPEAIEALLRATDDVDPATGARTDAPNATRTAVRDHLIDQLLQRSNKAEVDQAGNPMLNDAKMRTFVHDYRASINRVFSPDEVGIINRLVDAAQVMRRTERAGYRGGSDTYSMLSGSRFVDRILQGFMSRTGGGISGAGTWLMTGNPIAGAAVGAASMGAKVAYTRAQQQIERLMRDALADPELARTLMMPATKRNLEVVGPAIRKYLKTVTAGVAGPALRSPSGTQQALPAPSAEDDEPQAPAPQQASMAAPAAPATAAAPAGPQPGTVVNGYRFKGGNPNDQRGWEPVN